MAGIKGVERMSLIDYPGNVSAILFYSGCNFRCPYCHNPDLIERDLPDIPEDEVLAMLEERKAWLDGVCITGGEPLLHKGLPELIKKVKALGLKVKLDTNGTNPEMLESLLGEGLLDYIAMDIKAPLGSYSQAVRARVSEGDIEQSVGIIRDSGVDYEFRLTVVPGITEEGEIRAIGEWLSGSGTFFLQQFRPDITLDPAMGKEKPYPRERLEAFAELLRKTIMRVEIRD